MAHLIEEIVIGNTAIKVKFLRTVRVSTITNDRFTLAKSAATPLAVTDPFRPIEVSVDYLATSRTLILYFNNQLEPVTTYTFTITGLKDASGVTIPTESVEFTTSEETVPDADDPVDPSYDPQPIPVEDYTVDGDGGGNGTGGDTGGDSGSTGDIDNSFFYAPTQDDFYIVRTDPPVTEPLVDPAYKDGRVTVEFNKRPALTFITPTYFKAQRRKISREFARWETLSAQVSIDSVKPLVYIDYPAADGSQAYHQPDTEYFPSDYKYRLRVSRDVDAAAGAADAGTSQGTLNLTIPKGATFQKVLTYLQGTGQPHDLTGFTAQMQIRTGYGGTLVLELNTENGGIAINGPDGQITIMISAEQTSNLNITSGVYDLELSSPAATPIVTRLVGGKITVTPEVTV